jgi:transcriptional antiterminator NusG
MDQEVTTSKEVPMARPSLRERLTAKRASETGEQGEMTEGHWYVLHTYSGYENKVKKTIESKIEARDLSDRVYEIVVPTQEEIEIRQGQRHNVMKKVFPGYVLVRMELDEETWYELRNTPGVTGFVSSQNKPVQLTEEEAQNVLKGMTAAPPKVKIQFVAGDTVRIIDGPFADFRGEIDEINNEKGKIKVLVSFFGRETPVELDFLQAEREL